MKHQKLCLDACQANRAIDAAGLAPFTWGNVSAADRRAGVMAIKPSGVDYAKLRPADMVIVDLHTGRAAAGAQKPSSDTPTHLELYRAFPTVNAVVHTHSKFATAWAQARRAIPCLGTTHADVFYGPVPLTRMLRKPEVEGAYEANTGEVIVECFKKHALNPDERPGVLVAGHGPFAWGADTEHAVLNARMLESLAEMAYYTFGLSPRRQPPSVIPDFLLDRHFLRKHGANAYYGQCVTGRGRRADRDSAAARNFPTRACHVRG